MTSQSKRTHPFRMIATLVVAICLTASPLAFAEETEATKKLKERTSEFRKDVVQVAENVYVAVGFTPANVSMIIGESGVVIVDTGMSPSHAKRILDAFREITDLPVQGIVYTHGHGDHTGGAGVFAGESEVEIWGHANLGEEGKAFDSSGITINKLRGARQAGFKLDPTQRINNGIAPAMKPERKGNPFASDAEGFIPPNRVLKTDRIETEIAGVHLELVAAPGETDDQLYVWLPESRVLFAGDNFYKSWPNLYAIRGTPYRDVQAWAESVDAMIQKSPAVLVGGHTRPIVGEEEVEQMLIDYRDAVRFVFEKTVEGINQGMTPDQLVEYVRLPERFAEKDYLTEYYGNVEWGVRAIFTGYLGWFDGNPTHLFSLPPKEEAERMADLCGGPEALLEKAKEALEADDPQWAAQLADHLIALDPDSTEPKQVKAEALMKLGQRTLTATGRNYYLSVAMELLEEIQRDR